MIYIKKEFIISVFLFALVTFTWTANDPNDLLGYTIRYGTASGVYTTNTDLGNVTNVTIELTAPDNYVVVAAENTSSEFSADSVEVRVTIGNGVYTAWEME